jgi:hypothetical protein
MKVNVDHDPLRIKIGFFKNYEIHEHIQTKKKVEAVTFRCHEFPDFECTLPQTIETEYAWKELRNFVLLSLMEFLTEKTQMFTKHVKTLPPEKVWEDDYHASMFIY